MISSTVPARSPIQLTSTGPHAEAVAAAKTDLVGGSAGGIHVETLPNGVRMIIAERPGAKQVKVQVGMGAGSLQDPSGKLGLAHLLEHLTFEGSPKMSSAKQEDLRTRLGNNWNAYTDRNSVVYYGIAANKDAGRAASLLGDMFRNPATTGPRVKQELAAVKNEMIFGDGSMTGELWHVMDRMVHGDGPFSNNVIGSRKSVDAITTKDLRGFHDAYFTGRNTVVLVEGDAKSLPLEQVRRELGKLEPGGRVDHAGDVAPVVHGKAVQIVRDPAHKAVDLSLAFPLTDAQVAKLDPIRSKLVTSAISNQLFATLRRSHHLTYGSWAELQEGDAGEGALLVLQASVAPEAVRAATRDLAATARDALDGFGPETLRRDKQQMTSLLRMKDPALPLEPAVTTAAEEAFQGALLEDGVPLEEPPKPVAVDAKIRKLGAITVPQFAATAKQLIDLADMKVLAFGDVDQADVRGGLVDAGVDLKGIDMNPVDLSLYAEMGLGGTKPTRR